MTDKERLESLKRNKKWTEATGEKFYAVHKKDYKWLIKQAERARELEAENRMLRTVAESNKYIGEQCLEQNKRYREALTYYAEESNYDYDVRVDSISYVGDQSEMKFYRLDSKILNDKGERARKALEGEE